MNGYLEIVVRGLIAVTFLFILTRIEGAKQISQLTFYDYVVGISVGSIGAAMAIDRDLPILYCMIGMAIFTITSVLTSFLTNKSILARRLFTGSPTFLVVKGEILFEGLKKAHYDINDMLREMRTQGFFDISQINYAILETNGSLSIMPKEMDKPITASDMNIALKEKDLLANVIIDGKILAGNLKVFDKSKDWLKSELNNQNIDDISLVALATLDESGNLAVYLKNFTDENRTIFQ